MLLLLLNALLCSVVLTTLMVSISENEENILQYTQVVSAIEFTSNIHVGLAEIAKKLKANLESKVGNLTHSVLEAPNNTIHNKLELNFRKHGNESWETLQVDFSQ